MDIWCVVVRHCDEETIERLYFTSPEFISSQFLLELRKRFTHLNNIENFNLPLDELLREYAVKERVESEWDSFGYVTEKNVGVHDLIVRLLGTKMTKTNQLTDLVMVMYDMFMMADKLDWSRDELLSHARQFKIFLNQLLTDNSLTAREKEVIRELLVMRMSVYITHEQVEKLLN